MDESPQVLVDNRGKTRLITLNRPESLNAVTISLLRGLADAIESASADKAARAIVITGAGRAFCAGADLAAERDDSIAGLDEVARIVFGLTQAPKPVFALVNGAAAGVGTSILMACDIVLAKESAFLKQAFDRIGLAPDGGGTSLLPANIGRSRALQIALLGDRITSQEAKEIGLFARVWADDEFEEHAWEVIDRVADGPVLALAATKAAINDITLSGLAAALDHEKRAQSELLATNDFAEGVAAFYERRLPVYRGD